MNPNADYTANTVLYTVWTTECHYCYARTGDFLNPQPFRCDRCHRRYYCSSECKAADTPSHVNYCPPYTEAQWSINHLDGTLIRGYDNLNLQVIIKDAVELIMCDWFDQCASSGGTRLFPIYPFSPFEWKDKFRRTTYYHLHLHKIIEMEGIQGRIGDASLWPVSEFDPSTLRKIYTLCDRHYPAVIIGYTVTDVSYDGGPAKALPYIFPIIHKVPLQVMRNAYIRAVGSRRG